MSDRRRSLARPEASPEREIPRELRAGPRAVVAYLPPPFGPLDLVAAAALQRMARRHFKLKTGVGPDHWAVMSMVDADRPAAFRKAAERLADELSKR